MRDARRALESRNARATAAIGIPPTARKSREVAQSPKKRMADGLPRGDERKAVLRSLCRPDVPGPGRARESGTSSQLPCPAAPCRKRPAGTELVPMSTNVDRYWEQYLASLPVGSLRLSRCAGTCAFGLTSEDARAIAPLVLAGTGQGESAPCDWRRTLRETQALETTSEGRGGAPGPSREVVEYRSDREGAWRAPCWTGILTRGLRSLRESAS